MRKTIGLVVLIIVALLMGYYGGYHVATKQSIAATASGALNHAISSASICGNHLHYANPEPGSKASFYSTTLFVQCANQAIELLNKGVKPFFPIESQKEGITRGRDYMRNNGLNDQAARADALLSAITTNENKISK